MSETSEDLIRQMDRQIEEFRKVEIPEVALMDIDKALVRLKRDAETGRSAVKEFLSAFECGRR